MKSLPAKYYKVEHTCLLKTVLALLTRIFWKWLFEFIYSLRDLGANFKLLFLSLLITPFKCWQLTTFDGKEYFLTNLSGIVTILLLKNPAFAFLKACGESA